MNQYTKEDQYLYQAGKHMYLIIAETTEMFVCVTYTEFSAKLTVPSPASVTLIPKSCCMEKA